MDLWSKLLTVIQKEVSKQAFDTWFVPTRLILSSSDRLTIGVPTDFFRDYIEDKYKIWLEEKLKGLEKRCVFIDFIVTPNQITNTIKEEGVIPEFSENLVSSINSSPSLNPRYLFGNFVVGDTNRFAHAACLAVAESPGKAYNPLFIYGGVGLGKTHLLHATGLETLKNYLKKRVFYVSSEQFTNEFIDAIRYDHLEVFKNKYRGIDVLLIDDIQFLAGKETTQEEFFHTFNSLYESRRQIIISSDRPPRDIPTIEDRLRSRFESGLITDIKPPNLETRIVILKNKVEQNKLDVSDEVIFFIAERIKNNIRELEGALVTVSAYASLYNEKLDVTLVKNILKDVLVDEEPLFVSIDSIQRKVVKYFKLQMSDMISKKRSGSISLPRQIGMYLSRELTNFSLPEIGARFGGKDHTTVLHAYKKIKEKIKKDEHLRLTIENLKEELKKPV